MANESNSILLVGFNTRPLAYSLKKALYNVYAVDFFGDLDLYPYVDDCIIVLKELKSTYIFLKDKYSRYLAEFALTFHRKYRDVKFLLIGSGLDDAYEERELIYDEIRNYGTLNINNNVKTIKKSRDIEYIHRILKLKGYKVPTSYSFEGFQSQNLKLVYPFILKKKRSAGGTNVFKIENKTALTSQIKILEKKVFIPSEWLIQEYIEGIPVSCTIISNGNESEVISINRQIVGLKCLNSPKEFMYCGNMVPAGLSEGEERIISEISLLLTRELELKGINGFDFVIKDNFPYIMECNPRIPGSISASESVLNLNLLDLHIKSFIPKEWKNIKNLIENNAPKGFTTKLIYFAPKEIDSKDLLKINNLKFIYDKPEPIRNILKGEPLCSILFKAESLSKSYNGALEIANKINRIIDYKNFLDSTTEL